MRFQVTTLEKIGLLDVAFWRFSCEKGYFKTAFASKWLVRGPLEVTLVKWLPPRKPTPNITRDRGGAEGSTRHLGWPKNAFSLWLRFTPCGFLSLLVIPRWPKIPPPTKRW